MKEERYYVKNVDLLPEMIDWKETKKISNELGRMFIIIATNLSKKANFAGYTMVWKEEMIQEAVLTCVKYGKNFNPEKSNNPFAYITTICYNAFRLYIIKQKRHSEIKDKIFNAKDEYLAIRDADGSAGFDRSVDYTQFLKK